MNELAECPICIVRIPITGDAGTNLSLHMSTHSKEEVVAALLGRTRTSQESIPRITQPVNLSSNINTFIGNVSISRINSTYYLYSISRFHFHYKVVLHKLMVQFFLFQQLPQQPIPSTLSIRQPQTQPGLFSGNIFVFILRKDFYEVINS